MTPDPTNLASVYATCFPRSRPWTQQEFADILANSAYLVETEGEAFAIVRIAVDQAEIITIAVPPALRRKGQARRMLRTLMARALTEGATELFLEVEDSNLPALALYKNEGFTESGRRKAYYRAESGDLNDAIIMAKPLK